jgi:hypothetical protein
VGRLEGRLEMWMCGDLGDGNRGEVDLAGIERGGERGGGGIENGVGISRKRGCPEGCGNGTLVLELGVSGMAGGRDLKGKS